MCLKHAHVHSFRKNTDYFTWFFSCIHASQASEALLYYTHLACHPTGNRLHMANFCLETSVYIFRRQLSTWALLFAQLANSQLIYTLHAMPCRQWSGHPFPFCSNLYSIYPKRKTKEWIIIHFSYAMVKTTSPWPLLRFSLGRGRQWLQGRSHIIRVPRWFRKDPRVKYLVPHIRHAGKAPMNAVCKLLWVCLLLWCQQLTLPDRIQRCVGVLPIIWHPRDVNHCDWNLLHGASRLYYQIKHPHVMVQVQGLAVVLIRKGLLYASDPLRISPVVWAVFTRRKQVLARPTHKEMSEISWQFATQKQQKFEASFMLTPFNHNCFYFVPFLFFSSGTWVLSIKSTNTPRNQYDSAPKNPIVIQGVKTKSKCIIQDATNGPYMSRTCPCGSIWRKSPMKH